MTLQLTNTPRPNLSVLDLQLGRVKAQCAGQTGLTGLDSPAQVA